MSGTRSPEARLAIWQERLDYLEREIKRLPLAIESARRSIAYWEERIASGARDKAQPFEATPTDPLTRDEQLTREDNRYLARYHPERTVRR